MKISVAVCLFCLNLASAQSVATPFPGTTTYPYDFENSTSQPLAAGTVYKPVGGSHTDSSHWGWQCVVTNGPGMAFGGNLLFAPDAKLHTRVLQAGNWVRIDSALRAVNPLQNYCVRAWALRERLKDALSRARYVFFEGRVAQEEAAFLADSVTPELTAVSAALTQLAADLRAETGLSSYADSQAESAASDFSQAAAGIPSLASGVTGAALAALRDIQTLNEAGAGKLDAEPSARALSMIAYDSVTGLFVIFGGDHLDYLTNDVWVFDPAVPQWRQRHCANAPEPRADHWFLPGDSGRINMKGGYTYAPGGTSYRHAGPAEWAYDVARNLWINRSGAPSYASGIRQYRTVPVCPEYFMGNPKPAAAANEAVLAAIPTNTWVDMNPPFRSPGARDWGSVAYDPDRDMFYVYSGGHCVYSGTDVLHYHLAANRYEMTSLPEFPLGWVAGSEGANGWSFNLRPWMSGHLWNSYEYHPVLKKMMVIGRQANCCGAPHDRYVYYYDPDRAEWESRQFLDSMPNNCYSVQACYSSIGMLNWHGDEMWRLNDTTMVWERLDVTGTMPGASVDFCGIVFDPKRNRALMVTCGGYHNPFSGIVHALDLSSKAVTQLTPSNAASVSMAWPLREIVYLPQKDVFLFAGSDHYDFDNSDSTSPGFLVYDPVANLWMSAAIAGTCDYGVNSGLFYDAKRGLVWHVNNGGDGNGWIGNVKVLKIDTSSLVLTLVDNPGALETASRPQGLSLTNHPTPVSNKTRIRVTGIQGANGLFLGVYDIRGKLIQNLTRALESGSEVLWDARGLGSEVYIIRLRAGNRTLTCKAPVMR